MSFNWSTFILFWVISFVFFHTHAQTNTFREVSGRIVDQKTKEPLALASVTLIPHQGSTVTNKEGRFSIKVPFNAPPQELSVSYMGYESARLAIGKAEEPLIISLLPSTMILREVTVSVPQDPGVLVDEMLQNRELRRAYYRTIQSGIFHSPIIASFE